MKTILCMLALLGSGLVHAVDKADVERAVKAVAPTMKLETQVVEVNMEDPIGAVWVAPERVCKVFVSQKNLHYVGLLMFSRPQDKMLEGLIAHELAHCIDMRAVINELGDDRANQHFASSEVKLQSEILADIVAFMYWKKVYPTDADYLIDGLLIWRKACAATDVLHYTYPALVEARPIIPARIDYEQAKAVREAIR
jgi:hypothetical protein